MRDQTSACRDGYRLHLVFVPSVFDSPFLLPLLKQRVRHSPPDAHDVRLQPPRKEVIKDFNVNGGFPIRSDHTPIRSVIVVVSFRFSVLIPLLWLAVAFTAAAVALSSFPSGAGHHSTIQRHRIR